MSLLRRPSVSFLLKFAWYNVVWGLNIIPITKQKVKKNDVMQGILSFTNTYIPTWNLIFEREREKKKKLLFLSITLHCFQTPNSIKHFILYKNYNQNPAKNTPNTLSSIIPNLFILFPHSSTLYPTKEN